MSSPESSSDPTPRLQFSIAHLLMLMVACSVSFAMIGHNFEKRWTNEVSDKSFEPLVRRAAIVEIVNASVTAIAAAGAAACIVAAVRGQISGLSPGHLMLLIHSLFSLVIMGLSMFRDSATYYVTDNRLVTAIGVVYGMQAISWIVFACWVRRSMAWLGLGITLAVADGLLAFLLAGLGDGLIPMSYLMELLEKLHVVLPCIYGIALMLAAVATWEDRRQTPRRDWLHYLGVVLVSSQALFNILTYIL